MSHYDHTVSNNLAEIKTELAEQRMMIERMLERIAWAIEAIARGKR